GCTLGVVFLLRLKADVLLLLMGLFVSAYAVYGLAVRVRPANLSGFWAVPMGTVGGLFGALFGSGGFLYALYLSARLEAKEQ
ncbi:sulfite exporter TauE/SafE family protein, partial [Pseudomonas sp. SIMBA_064]